MTKTAFFIRFTIVYTVAMAITGVSMSLIGFEEVSHLNTPILMSISFWFFYSYSNKNERVIVGGETWALIFLALLGDIITTVLLGTIY